MSKQLSIDVIGFVCKSAAAELTSDYRAQAWQRCADQQTASVKTTRDSLRAAGYQSHACDGGRAATTNVRRVHVHVHCMSACITRGTRHAMRRCCACRGRCELHAPSASCCVCACTVPVLDGPVCPACARSRQAVRLTERRLQSVAAARRQGRPWKRTNPPWAWRCSTW